MEIVNRILDRIGTGDIIAVGFTGTAVFLYVTTGEIPETLLVLTSTIVGAFYGKDILTKGQVQGADLANPRPPAPLINDGK